MQMTVLTDAEWLHREIEYMIHQFVPDARPVFAAANGDPEAACDCGPCLHLKGRLEPAPPAVAAEGWLSPETTGSQAAAPARACVFWPLETAGDESLLADSWPPADPHLRRSVRRALLHVLHEVLAQWTGIRQPWGILSGIRPTKLVHQMRRAGRSADDIRRELTERLLVAPDKADLLLEIVERQLEVVSDLDGLAREASVYVGIPFCPTHCAYCTFPAYSMAEKAAYVDGFLAAMVREIRHTGQLLREYGVPVTTVYIGGGTPTSLRADELDEMLAAVTAHIPGAGRWREFTVEAGRPDTITPDRLAVLRRYGVNRISVNPQTYNAATLRAMRRGHTPEMVDHRFVHVRAAGFDNINMDMILGLPGETADDMRHTLGRMMRLEPEAITVHTLAFKRSAALRDHRDSLPLLPDAELRALMAEVSASLRAGGWRPYYLYRQKDILANLENIGYAKPGKESPYNILMMEEAQLVIGIGGGAVTKLVGPGIHAGRFANPREPRAYIETIEDVMARKERALRPVLEAIRDSRRGALTSAGHPEA